MPSVRLRLPSLRLLSLSAGTTCQYLTFKYQHGVMNEFIMTAMGCLMLQVRLAVAVGHQGLSVRPLPSAPSNPRSFLLPDWQWDAVADTARIARYAEAIRWGGTTSSQ
jgi:hypothetical protein